MKKRLIAVILCFIMICTMCQIPNSQVNAQSNDLLKLVIKTADGTTKTIDFINPVFTTNGGTVEVTNSISLFTTGTRAYINESTVKTNVAVIVDSNMTVTQVINKSVDGAKPTFTESTDIEAPEGGFVLLAYDTSYATAGYKSFLATKFEVGDQVNLLFGEEETTLYEVLIAAGFRGELSYTLDGLMVETAFDANFESSGTKKEIDYVNPDFGTVPITNSISIFTYGNRPFVSDGSIKTNVAVVVDRNMTVTQVINQSVNGAKPSFTESTDVEVPEGGFVLLAYDSSYATAGYKSFLATNFSVGDVIKLLVNDTNISLTEILRATGQDGSAKQHAQLRINNDELCTVAGSTYTIHGTVLKMQEGVTYTIRVDQVNASNSYLSNVLEDGTFSIEVSLSDGANYFDLTLVENGIAYDESVNSVIAYRKDSINATDKPVIVWIDQFASAKNLNSVEKIEKMVANAKKAGVTAFAFDVKGCEGYVSYKKNNISNTPYMTETKNPNKAVTMEIDFLQEVLNAAHKNGIQLYASLNFFVEGNISTNDYAIDMPNTYPDWAERLQAPEDKGEIKSVLSSLKKSTLAYVNPGNEEVRKHQLGIVEDVISNYDVDGIIVDRGRYDNQYSDFSDLSKQQFTEYLAQQGKTLTTWPDDAFKIDADGKMVTGIYYLEWLSYRSSVIKSFMEELRGLVNQYETSLNKEIALAAYVGSWYESYYQTGVNWADDSFVYNSRLEFPLEDLYASDFGYSNTSYVEYIDFIMTGCYYTTQAQMQKYVTLSNILINDAVPVYASIDLTNIPEAQDQRTLFQEAYDYSDGSMIFDLCFIDWEKIRCAIADTVYQNTSVMGVYSAQTQSILMIDNIDTARAEDKITIYTTNYGTTTGTNQWGVEVVVDEKGYVTEVKNGKNAIDWNWAVPDLNDSTIVDGGFVLSTVDRSGTRVYRQLLANSFQVGDKVAAAVMSEFLDYEAKTYEASSTNVEVKIAAYGVQNSIKVLIQGNEAITKDGEYFSATVHLNEGTNEVIVEVYVDDLKVLEKTLILTATKPANEFVIGENQDSWKDVLSFIVKGNSYVKVELKDDTKVPAEVLNRIAKTSTTMELVVNSQFHWLISSDSKNKIKSDIDFGMVLNSGVIPQKAIHAIANSKDYVEISLNHKGKFKVSANLICNFGSQYSNQVASMFYFNPKTNALEWINSCKLNADGNGTFRMKSATNYVILFSDDIPYDVIMKQIAVSPSKVNLSLSGKTAKSAIKIEVPDQLTKLLEDEKLEMTVDYVSDNKRIASVSGNGKIVAKGFGKTRITVTLTIDDETVSFQIPVTVQKTQGIRHK